MKLFDILILVGMSAMLFLPIGVVVGWHLNPQEEPQPTIEEIADDLCLDWMRMDQVAAVEEAVEEARTIGKEPVDIHNALVAGCPPYWEVARETPFD